MRLFKQYTSLFVFFTLILVGISLYGYVNKSYERYLSSQQALLQQSISGTARIIRLYLEEERRRVRLFAEKETLRIRYLAQHPEDEDRHAALRRLVQSHFPEYFAFTIADAEGNVLLDDFEGRIGEVCQGDIQRFSSPGEQQTVHIHPNPLGYHFDIMTGWRAEDGSRGIFFISFSPSRLAKILASSQLHDHQLLLLSRDDQDLIEVAAGGSRIDLQRAMRLTAEESGRIEHNVEVKGSRWTLADLPDAEVFSDYKAMLHRQAATVFLIFAVFSAVMYWLIRREEEYRAAAEQTILESRDELETRVGDRTRELSRINSQLAAEVHDRQRAEELLRLTLKNAPIGIVTAGLDGKLLSVNPAFCATLGYTAEELLQMTIEEISHPDDWEESRKQLQGLLQGDSQQIDLEKRYIRRDGTIITGRVRVGLVRDANGRPLLLVGEMEDMTARERADMLFRLVVESAPNAIVMIDQKGKIVLVNSQTEKFFGYRRQELLGQEIEMLIPPRLRQIHPQYRRSFMVEDRARAMGFGRKLFGLRKDGSEFPIEIGLSPIKTGHENLVLSAIVDISERVRVDQELHRMRTYLKNIIDSMPSILVGIDDEGRITEWNQRAEQDTGVPTTKAIGRSCVDLFPELESQLDNVHEAIRTHTPVHTRRLKVEKKGETHYSDVVVYPLLANGAAGAVIRMDDITNRVRIEQMMVQTEKMLSVGGLAAGMAHEINNPLSGVLQSCQNIQRRLSVDLPANERVAESLGLNLDMIRRYLEKREILDFIKAIQDAAARASRIVADMLAFSRTTTTDFQPARVEEMVDTVVRLAASDYDLKKKYDFKQIEIVREYDPELEWITCDHTEIEQVLLNLVKNAAQAMASCNTLPPQRITLRTRRQGDYAQIEVEDNGPGMDEKTRQRVFEPFFTTKVVGVGTGLGLSVSYFIVTEQHRGTIEVRSVPGEGACFILRLPIHGREWT